MPIMVDKDTDTKSIRWRPSEKQVRSNLPWVKGYDPMNLPEPYEWDETQMTALVNVIKSSLKANDGKLAAAQGDIRKAVRAGYILVNVSIRDGTPNWHDIRQVVRLNGTGPQVAIIGDCPALVLGEAMRRLESQGAVKTYQPPTREKKEATVSK